MSETPTQGNEILVDPPGTEAPKSEDSPGAEIVSYVVGKVDDWEDHRDRGYSSRWEAYWRLWRGQWDEQEKNRASERSRLIAPALSSAIDSAVSEIEEALFARELWFDVADDIADEKKGDAVMARDFLLEDLETVNARDQIIEAVQNAAIFGTGIVKINTIVDYEQRPKRNPRTFRMEKSEKERVYVSVESIRPDEFIPDPAGRNISEMHGCAHRVTRPLHYVLERIESGLYLRSALATVTPQRPQDTNNIDPNDPQTYVATNESDQVDVLEYHGKVPLKFLTGLQSVKTELDALVKSEALNDSEDGPLVEAIVTVANKNTLLRAMINPFTMGDRSIIAFPYERVPGRFWGRSVSEKGYNPQKALDTEIRARMDALGFVSSPMLGIDAGRMPRGFKMEIKPGKIWTTQGPPGEVLHPVVVGEINAGTFNQASEMERMVQMGTGAFDSATALKQQSQSGASGLSSNSMFMGAFVKRAKRGVQNVDRNFVSPLIKKVMWRYMQYEPRRYPQDYEFQVKASIGIVAREVEAMQLTQMLGMMPEEKFPTTVATIVRGIVDHTSLANKAQIEAAIEKDLNPQVTPEQKELMQLQQEAAKAALQGEMLKNQKTIAEIRKLMAEAEAKLKEGDIDQARVMNEVEELRQNMEEIRMFGMQNMIALRGLQLKDRELDIKEKAVNKKPSGST